MANMSYCRFQNTLPDLKDCLDNMDSEDLSKEEKKARKMLIELCVEIAELYGEEEEEEE